MRVNGAVRVRAAASSDLHYFDAIGPMLEDGRPRDIFDAGNLHMTRAGYEIWTRILRAALLPMTKTEAHSCRRMKKHE